MIIGSPAVSNSNLDSRDEFRIAGRLRAAGEQASQLSTSTVYEAYAEQGRGLSTSLLHDLEEDRERRRPGIPDNADPILPDMHRRVAIGNTVCGEHMEHLVAVEVDSNVSQRLP